MDPRWEQPTLTVKCTMEEVGDIAARMASVTTMLEDVFMFMLQAGTDEDAVEVLRNSLVELHQHERAEQLGEEPYDEAIIRTVRVASVVFTEIGDFLMKASRAFIVDFEVENGGES